MKIIGFDNIYDHVVALEDFAYKWRFTGPLYNALPAIHAEQLLPLNNDASELIWNWIRDSGLHNNQPFKIDLFKTVDIAKLKDGSEADTKMWLNQLGVPSEKKVILSWEPGLAMIVPYRLLVEYFDDFYYPVSDDLTVVDESLSWALLFHHTDHIYFGSNMTPPN